MKSDSFDTFLGVRMLQIKISISGETSRPFCPSASSSSFFLFPHPPLLFFSFLLACFFRYLRSSLLRVSHTRVNCGRKHHKRNVCWILVIGILGRLCRGVTIRNAFQKGEEALTFWGMLIIRLLDFKPGRCEMWNGTNIEWAKCSFKWRNSQWLQIRLSPNNLRSIVWRNIFLSFCNYAKSLFRKDPQNCIY